MKVYDQIHYIITVTNWLFQLMLLFGQFVCGEYKISVNTQKCKISYI